MKGKILERIELPKRKLTKEEFDIIYNNGKSVFEKREFNFVESLILLPITFIGYIFALIKEKLTK